jgi:hypothetical protein
MKLTSPAFAPLQTIPAKFTCDGVNVSPELHIEGVPRGTRSLVLVMDDPDATGGRTWDHWVVWNIDPTTTVITEEFVPVGATQGLTSFGDQKYGGPCPPRGSKPHRYMFKLYALDIKLDLPPSSRKTDVERAMEGHVVAEANLMGLFGH